MRCGKATRHAETCYAQEQICRTLQNINVYAPPRKKNRRNQIDSFFLDGKILGIDGQIVSQKNAKAEVLKQRQGSHVQRSPWFETHSQPTSQSQCALVQGMCYQERLPSPFVVVGSAMLREWQSRHQPKAFIKD